MKEFLYMLLLVGVVVTIVNYYEHKIERMLENPKVTTKIVPRTLYDEQLSIVDDATAKLAPVSHTGLLT